MRQILDEDGFESLTMAEVAARSGISRRALYLHFASRADLVAALAGEMRADRSIDESLEAAFAAPTADAAVDAWANHVAIHGRRMLPVDRAIAFVSVGDPVAQDRLEAEQARRLESCRRLAARLADLGALSPEWTEASAADLIYALSGPEAVERLMVERGWSEDAFAERHARTLRGALLAGAADRATPVTS
ncbi:helix-turn-helix transcriptional regulator [Thermoleophilia bacterium SCSIO 60948]|nr:helix-turn-helix transcriptional regulator [Thermoleophilia bacterium SCSIO 60948]